MTKDVCWWTDYVVDDNGTVYRKKDGVALKQYLRWASPLDNANKTDKTKQNKTFN